jgi:hypothetical protein
VFESVLESWVTYSTRLAAQLPEADPRHNLSSEVRTRLRELDLVLRYLEQALSTVRPDPRETARIAAWMQENQGAFERGEISEQEWINGVSGRMSPDPQAYVDAWDSVALFTEDFYRIAWRLREILSRGGTDPLAFPHVERVTATGVRRVRDELIEHPEDFEQNFKQGLIVTDAGPVLRTMGAVVRVGTGEVHPSDDTIDEGLYVTAAAFRDELQRKFDHAIAALPREETTAE